MADARGVNFQSAECECRSGLSAEERVDWLAGAAFHASEFGAHREGARRGRRCRWRISRKLPAAALKGEIAGHKILLGSRAWVAGSSRGRTISKIERQPRAPSASVLVAIDGSLRGAFAFENSLRPEVEKLIARLGGRFELALLSGDNEREAARFQKIFGERAMLRFNQSPADKLNFIRELQQRGRKVMMVGDGLNDAGALKQADVGVAVVEQVGVFSPASDVILDAAELPRLARVLDFSRRAARVVRAGFVISALYNLVGVSIAAAGLAGSRWCARF